MRAHTWGMVGLVACLGCATAEGELITSDAGDGAISSVGRPDASPHDPGRARPRIDGALPRADGAPSDAAPSDATPFHFDATHRDAAPGPLDAAPRDAAAPALPPPAARPPDPPPDASDIPRDLAAQRPDLLEGSCVDQGGTRDFLLEVVRRLHARDPRWGFVLRDGGLLEDRAGYFWGDGPAEGSPDLYVMDFIARHCARPGIDEPAAPAWLDDSNAGGLWTLRLLDGQLPPLVDAGPPPADAPGPGPMRPLPDERGVVNGLAGERPDLVAGSCVDQGGNNEFVFEVVRRLRAGDERWGLNWKRGNIGDMSQDAIDYFWADGDPEGRTEVYILDIISGHCGDSPGPAWTDVTEATRLGGTIGRWTVQPLPR